MLLVATVLALAVLLLRAAQLQIVSHRSLSARAKGQQEISLVLHASRGAILDRSGQRLAVSEEGFTIGADVGVVKDARATANAVARAVPGTRVDDILARLETRGVLHVDLVRQAAPAAAKALQAQRLPGLTFTPEERRVYPAGVAGQVLGIVDIDGHGQEGLERQYDGVLRGTDGEEVRVRDPRGDTISVARTTPPRPGSSIRLTIDRDIQSDVERLIQETLVASRAKDATAIVLDPKTGGILAVASAPGPFGGGDAYRAAKPADRRLRAFTDQYEPGSTFKAVTFSDGLALGRLTPSTEIDVSTSWKLYDRTLTDAHPVSGRFTVADILKYSSNIGTAKAAYLYLSGRGAADKGSLLAPFIDKVGFGRPTGVDFPGESPGTVLPYSRWSGTTIMTVPIGHGIAVTPVQLASFYAALANGGTRVCPHLVGAIGTGPTGGCASPQRLFPARVASQMTRMLEGVVSGDGTGSAAQIPGYSVAGKTGTTKKIDPDGTYSSTRYVAWFVGYAPITNPRVVTLVMVDEPKGAYYGGQVAAPAFAQITSRALLALGVPQDRPVVRTTTTP